MSDGRFGRLGGGRGPGSHGSNPAHMAAMDLQTRPRGAAPAAARYGDNSALSARHMLIRHKLMERKRFDSADYAMDKNKRQKEDEQSPSPSSSSPAQVGASVFLSALQDQPRTQPAADPADAARAARYGGLAAAGAASARSILLHKKLREKKHFDSADYQLAAQQQQASAPAGGGFSALVVGTASGGSSPMDVDEEDADVRSSINSPSAARVGVAAAISTGELRLAQMSPSVRGGGGRPAGAFSSPSRRPQPPDERFFVPAAGPGTPPGLGLGPDRDSTAESAAAPGGATKYGKLCAAHVLIRRQLRERKRFDSADYAMENQGGGALDAPADDTDGGTADEGGSAGALRGGHVVMSSPTRHRERRRSSASPAFLTTDRGATSPSISHQVKHIKLSEDARVATGHGMGWRGASASSSSSSSSTNPGGSRAATMSQDSRLAARSIILQRKLAERKRFDSADYYKARSTTSG